MALAKFSIIVAIDSGNGIAKRGGIPWNSKEDSKFFRDTTMGRGRNVVIMGRHTYESIQEEYRPLQGRRCIIISRTWRQEDHPEVSVYASLIDALAGIGSSINSYEDVFIAGGEQIYKDCIKNFMYLCKKIYVTKFKTDYGCDQFFPLDMIRTYPQASDPTKTRDYIRYYYLPNVSHDEYEYLKVLEDIKNRGEHKPDRTGVGTTSLFGVRMEFDIRDRLPILTTKKINFDAVIKELIFFISGKTDTSILSNQGVKIWEANTKKSFIEDQKLSWNENDMGPMYGHQWRHWGADYKGCHENYDDQGIDQLSTLINSIRTNPHSRRLVLSSWNVSQLNEMVIAPCHILAQFNVSSDRKYLDCQLYQRSGDMFLGVPFNIVSYSLLTYMIAHITGLKPRKFIHIIGDAHIYSNHGDQVKKQLSRTPRPFPTLSFREATRLHEIDNFTTNSFIIEGYNSWPAITADMAI